MKRMIGALLCLILTVLPLSACTQKTEVETEYKYTYDVWKGDFVLVPYVQTVHHDAEYEILYRITYDDGSTTTRWEYVGEVEYERLTP